MQHVTRPFLSPPYETYLAALQELTHEIQQAVVAITMGALADFEGSVVRQQLSCVRLTDLRDGLSSAVKADAIGGLSANTGVPDCVHVATSALEDVTRHYSMLLKHFGGTARLFSGMFRNYGDPAVAGFTVPRSQTAWSCEL